MTETLAQQFGSAGQLDALPQRTDVTDATVADGEPVRIKVMKLAG
jgi:isoleucyl-tRNA synthetase